MPSPKSTGQFPPTDRRPSKHELGGRVVAGGQATRTALARLLGIDDLQDAYAVTATAWMDHAVEVAVADRTGGTHVFRIERRGPESGGLALTPHLNIYARGTDVPAPLVAAVERAAPRRLHDWTTDQLAAALESDPDAGRPGAPMPPPRDEQQRPHSLLDTWGATDSHADFFAGGELSRSQLDSIDPSKIFQFVQHSDAECLYVNPRSIGTVVTLVNYPWDGRVRSPGRPFEQGMANTSNEEVMEEGMFTSNLVEDDVILGNPKKLEDLLQFASSLPNPKNKLLFVSNTCVPTIIGDDVESAVKRARRVTGKPILYLTVTPRSMTNVFQGILVDRRLAAERASGPPRPHAINLVGFAGDTPCAELGTMLAAAGIEVNVRLLPTLNGEQIDTLPRAALNVFYPNQLWQHLYDQITERSRTTNVTFPAPYGVEGTRDWLRSVSASVHPQTDPAAAWQAYVQPYAERWATLRARAATRRLGFVVRDTEAYYLTSPAASWGVPLVAAIEEMGFGIDVLVHVSSPKLAKESALAIRKQFRDGARHSVLAFDGLPLLRQRLTDSNANAFLSYHFFDWRLTEAGKASFSIQHFEPGVPGAIRTLERLLAVCDTSFFRRYRKYLARTPEGLRPPEIRNDDPAA